MTDVVTISLSSKTPSSPFAQSVESIAASFGADPAVGLSAAQVVALRNRFGANRLAEAPPASRWLRFLRQFNELVIWVLIAAAIISGLLSEWTDAIAIIAIIVLNGLLGFFQEEKADQALAALKKLSAPQTRVRREGAIVVLAASELVPGDRVELEAGDLVPADVRLISTTAFRVDEAALTGESSPLDKTADTILDAATPLAERKNMAYLGTVVSAGKAAAIVVATGMQTELGRIAGLLQQNEPEPTPLQRQLAGLGRILVYLCVAIVAIIFLLQVLRGVKGLHDPNLVKVVQDAFLVAVSLAVAAVPEGLPAVVTIALALGLQRMVKRHALIRKLPSVETLGAVTVICSDKTGTLTRNEMTVREMYAGGIRYEVTGSGYEPSGEFKEMRSVGSAVRKDSVDSAAKQMFRTAEPTADLRAALTVGAWCTSAKLTQTKSEANWRLTGDPTEGALVVAAMKAGIEGANLDHELRYEIPFDSERKLMTVLAIAADGRSMFYTKGAPEAVLASCAFEQRDGTPIPLTEQRRAEILAINATMASNALRVLAMAFRDGTNISPEQGVEREMTFAGLAGMFDPPREEAREAVRKCLAAGIRPVMITGDHPLTALSIARDLGIASTADAAISGTDLDALDDAALAQLIETATVFARVTAEHKLRVVRALQANDQVVAMTGDGVNDAPAVKAADIGIAMGRGGTDVTREAADMVLTDDNFATIVAAVEEGRGIFDNIRKFVHYLLSCNTGEVLFMFVGTLVGWPVPLHAIQILWINLVTDALPALALGMEPPEPDVMSRRPRPPKQGVITWGRGIRMLCHGTLVAGATLAGFALVTHFDPAGPDRAERASTVAFCILSYSQLFYSFSCRSERYTLPQLGFFTNPHLVWAILISGLIQAAVFLPYLQRVFHVSGNLTWEWGAILGLSLLPVTIIEVLKIVKGMFKSKDSQLATIAT